MEERSNMPYKITEVRFVVFFEVGEKRKEKGVKKKKKKKKKKKIP